MRKFIFGKVAAEVSCRIRREDPYKNQQVNGEVKTKTCVWKRVGFIPQLKGCKVQTARGEGGTQSLENVDLTLKQSYTPTHTQTTNQLLASQGNNSSAAKAIKIK